MAHDQDDRRHDPRLEEPGTDDMPGELVDTPDNQPGDQPDDHPPTKTDVEQEPTSDPPD